MEVSIIIPAYNTGELLATSIHSVLSQSFSDWELIIVDDGSTDKTGEIADSYASNDDRIKVIHTPNEGAYAARLTGVAAALGRWITFIDSDDSISNDAISALFNLTSDDVDIVCGTLNLNNKRIFKHKINGVITNSQYFIALLQYKTSIGAVAKLFRKTLFRDIPRPEIKITLNEDLLLMLTLARNAKRILIKPDLICYNYYFRKGTGRTGQMTHEQWQMLFDTINRIAQPVMNDRIREAIFNFRFERIDKIMIARGLFVDKKTPYINETIEYAEAHTDSKYAERVVRLIKSPLRQRLYFFRTKMALRSKSIIKSIIRRK